MTHLVELLAPDSFIHVLLSMLSPYLSVGDGDERAGSRACSNVYPKGPSCSAECGLGEASSGTVGGFPNPLPFLGFCSHLAFSDPGVSCIMASR